MRQHPPVCHESEAPKCSHCSKPQASMLYARCSRCLECPPTHNRPTLTPNTHTYTSHSISLGHDLRPRSGETRLPKTYRPPLFPMSHFCGLYTVPLPTVKKLTIRRDHKGPFAATGRQGPAHETLAASPPAENSPHDRADISGPRQVPGTELQVSSSIVI